MDAWKQTLAELRERISKQGRSPVSIDEQEVRQRLEAVAEQSSPPRFAIESLIGRIRRRRARIIAAISGSLFAGTAIAVAVAIGLSAPSQPVALWGHPIRVPFRLSFTVTVNGRSMATPPVEPPIPVHTGPFPSFAVSPGEHLAINVAVTVPAHATVTAIWLGVTEGGYGVLRGGRPSGLSTILVHSRRTLAPGLHVFRMRWTVPAGIQPGTNPSLVVIWSAHHFDAGQFVAELVTSQHASPNGSGRPARRPGPRRLGTPVR